jgi:hypothetical protein
MEDLLSGMLRNFVISISTNIGYASLCMHPGTSRRKGWLCQCKSQIEWIAIADMVAYGLTKRLTKEKHQCFLEQLNLQDIGSNIQG